MTSRVSVSAAIYDPRADDMQLRDSKSDALFLTIADHIWFGLRLVGSDMEAEAAAMDRLAELATEAAARLRSVADQEDVTSGAEVAA